MKYNYEFLTLDTVVEYLEKKSRYLPFDIGAIEQVEEVDEYSNNNFLFRLHVRKGKKIIHYFLKQAQPFNRRSLKAGKPFAVPPSRVRGEVFLIRRLQDLWGKQTVPQIYFFDRTNYAFFMSDVSKHGRLLIDEFLKGRVHPEISAVLGRHLGKLHASTYKIRVSIGSDKDYADFLRKGFFNAHWGYGVRKFFPASFVDRFYRDVQKAPHSILWGDPVYCNIFVKPRKKVGYFDFDHAAKYDPMHDIGVLMAHWVWMWLNKNKKLAKDSEKFLQDCWRAYWSQWKTRQKVSIEELHVMQQRALRWLGIYLVSRTDGKSGSYFKKWPAWEKRIKKFGNELFGEQDSERVKLLKDLL